MSSRAWAIASAVSASVFVSGLVSCSADEKGGAAVVGAEGSDSSDGGEDDRDTTDDVYDSGTPGPSAGGDITAAPVVIERVTPPTGPTSGGSIVVVEGFGFDGTTRVWLREEEATVIKVLDATRLVIKTPPSKVGSADVTVGQDDGGRAVFSGGFTYWEPNAETPPAPRLVAIAPSSGPAKGGTALLLRGSGFQQGANILIGWRPAGTRTVASSTEASCLTPLLEPGTLDVAITNPDGQSHVLEGAFAAYGENRETAPAPEVDLVSPSAGSIDGGTLVRVTGSNLMSASIAMLGGTPLPSWKADGNGEASFTTLPHSAGLVSLWVTNTDGQTAIVHEAFQFFVEPPVVYSVSPDQGAPEGGNLITIRGEHFRAGATVDLTGIPCQSVTFVDSTTLTCIVPPAVTASVVDVTVTNPEGLSGVLPGSYTYVQSKAPVLTGVIPKSGPLAGGVLVLVEGQDIQPGATVKFGTVDATTVAVPGAGGLVATLPAGLKAGTVDVIVTNPNGYSATLEDGFTYVAEPGPSVAEVVPDHGSTAGGFPVAILGNGILPGATVEFGGVAAGTILVSGVGGLVAEAPAHAAGLVDIEVRNPDGQTVVLEGAFDYQAPPELRLDGVLPSSGPIGGGGLATVRGEGFAPGAVIRFGGTEATISANLGAAGAVVTIPASLVAGLVNVTVTNPGGATVTLTGGFTYETPKSLAITGIVPGAGPEAGGISVAILGQGFQTGAAVRFGAVQAVGPVLIGDGTLIVTQPPLPPGDVDVSVVNIDGQSATSKNGFTVLAKPGAPPKALGISAVTPSTGPVLGGGFVLVTGSGFPADLKISFGGTTSTEVHVLSPTLASARVPAGNPGTIDVVVSEALGGTALLAGGYAYLVPKPGTGPTLVSLAPATGPTAGATLARVDGALLLPGAQAFLDGIPATDVAAASPALASLRTPPGQSGPAELVWVNPDGQWVSLSAAFVYTTTSNGPPISLTALLPVQGPPSGGTAIAATGSGFAQGTLLFFDAIPVDATVVNATSLVAKSPAHAPGAISAHVTSPDGHTATLPGAFTYAVAAPAVHGVIPKKGPAGGGNTLSIVGTGFGVGATVLLGTSPCLGAVVTSSTELSCAAPSGVAGASVAVTVTNPDGLSGVLPGAYAYDAPPPKPALAAVSPGIGPTTGGRLALLLGAGFQVGATVTFGGVPATDIHVAGPDSAVATIPPHVEGTVDVTLVNPDGGTAVLTGGFKYEVVTQGGGASSLALAVIEPPTGPTSGGGFAILRGYDFQAGLTARFGSAQSPFVKVLDLTTAVARVPPGSAGPANVTVVSAQGATATLSGGYSYYTGSGSAPTLSLVKPSIGPTAGGTLAVFSGLGLQSGAWLFLDGAPATDVLRIAATLATARTPAGDAGPADVTWVNPDGAFAELKAGFVYTPGAPTPVQVGGISPIQGSVAGGTALTLTGSGFSPGLQLFLGGIPVSSTVASAKTLSATTPAHSPGLVDAVVTLADGATATLPDAFNFVLEQPFVAAVAPPVGLEADVALGKVTVTISGQGFNPAAKVRFGTVFATVVTWVDGGKVTAIVPVLPLGKVSVTVTNPDGLEDSIDGAFEVLAKLPGSEPALTGVAPNIGPLTGGTAVVLTGVNLPVDAAVLFGNAVATSVTVLDAQTVLVSAPPVATPGAVDVQVISAAGSLVLAKSFVYYDANSLGPWPVIASVRPPIGPSAGGTVAAIDVHPALATAEVWVGGVAAAVLGADASGMLVVRMPAHAPGPVAVTVVHIDGKSDTKAGAFTYYAGPKPGQKAPALAQVQPSGGSTSGGTAVSYLGDRIDDEAIAFLGYRGLVQPQWIDVTRMNGKTPVGDVGLSDAVVTNPDGLSAVLPAAFAFVAPKPNPEVVFPSVGSVAGGITIVLSGQDFHPAATVTIGGVPAQGVVVQSPLVLVAKLPPGSVGSKDVVVTNPGGLTGTLTGGFTYTDQTFTKPAPKAVSLVPDHGPYQGGTVLALYGTGFQTGARVLFGTALATTHRVEGTLIVLTTPKGFIGPSDVTVLNPDGQANSLAAGFTYLSPIVKAPKIFGITPPSGPEIGGTAAIVTGESFTGGGLGFVGYRPLSSWAVLNSAIGTGTVGVLEPGAHNVVVTNGDGQSATLANAYSAVAAPIIDTFEPSVGPVAGGTLVTIAGQGFASGLKLTFGGQPATAIQVLSPFVIKAVTPAGQLGPAAVQIQNPDGQKTESALPFEYLLPPTVASVFPTKGPSTGGTPVIITGTGLLPTSKVTFDGSAATVLAWVDDGTLVVKAPAGPINKKADILVTNPDAQSAILYAAFRWLDPSTLPEAPTLVGLTPPTGPQTGGTWGLVGGTNFVAGSLVLIDQAPSTTQIYGATVGRFVSPAGKETGTVGVGIVTPDGLWAYDVNGFSYTDPATLGPAPAVAEIDPNKGPTKGGGKVSLIGINLDPTALVFFDTNPALGVVPVTGGIEVTTPLHAAGPVSVRVTNNDGQTILVGLPYVFIPPPTITSVAPNSGPGAGGTFVTITGADFRQTPTVLLCTEYAESDDCSPATGVVWKNATTVEIVTPTHTAGTAEVVLINPDGQAAVFGGGFFFNPPPTVYSVVLPSGSTLGGTKVTLEGIAFQAGATVTIGGAPAIGIVVKNSEKIELTTPAGTTGPAVVVVRNPDGATHTLGGGFLYIPPPLITNVFPNLGPETGGTVITIQGSGFVPGLGGSVVRLGNNLVSASKTQIVSPILIQVEAPPGVGPAAVRVTNPDGQFAVLAGGFTYVPPIPAPEINAVSPPYGPTGGGYYVKVTGNHFLDGLEVEFGVGGVYAKGFLPDVKNNGTLIVVTAPTHPAGKVDVRVTNSDGQSDKEPLSFEYTAPSGLPGLAFVGVEPKRGPNQGGYTVSVFGQGFKQGVKVFIGKASTSEWVESPAVLRLGPTVLRVEMPSHANGPVDIRVSNPALGGSPDEVVGAGAFIYGQGAVFVPKGQLLPIDATQNDRDSVIVDVNGDGLNDVFVTHASNGRPDLFINTRDANGRAGVFVDQSAQLVTGDTFTSSWDQWFPKAFDADGDGDQDILVFRGPNDDRFWLFRNKGDGTLVVEPASNVAIDDPRNVTIADFNCDGHDDLFVSRWTNYTDEVLIGNGKGYWRHMTGILPTLKEPSRSAAASDVDHDGDMDLVLANDTAFQDRLYYNNCNNVGQPPSCAFDMPGFTMETYNGHRYAFSTSETNTWDEAEWRCSYHGMHLVTLDSAAERAYVYSKQVNGYYFWSGYRENAVENSWQWDQNAGQTYAPWCPGEPNETGKQCGAMHYSAGTYSGCLIDTNCASGYRYVCEAPVATVCAPWKISDSTYGPNKNFPNTGFDTWDAVMIDVDNNGWEDVFMANNGQSNRVYMNANGNFLADDGLRFPQEETYPRSMYATAVDVDIDGDTDLVIMKDITAGNMWPEVYLNDKMQGGIGTFTNASVTNMPPRRTEDTDNGAVGDLNADGLPDIHVINRMHQDWLMLNHGYAEDKPDIEQNRVPIGSFANNTNLGYPEDAWDTLAGDLGDIDGDDDLDLVVVTTGAQTLRLWVNDGDGNYVDQTGTRVPNYKRNAKTVRFADINEDGDLDIIELDDNTAPGFLTILANDGTGRYSNVSAKNTPSVGVGWQNMTVADMDRDGDPDLVVTSTYYTDWTVTVLINGGDAWNNDGAYFFTQGQVIPYCNCYYYGKAVAVADMDKDLWPDIYAGLDGQQNRLMFNDGTMKFVDKTQSHLSAVADATKDVDIFDADLDGDLDIFVTNTTEDRLHLGELNFKLGDVTASNLPISTGPTGTASDSRSSAIGDFDKDGLPDIVTANYNQKNNLLLNVGSAFFENFSDNLPNELDYSQDVLTGDTDGDGDLDLVILGGGADRIYLNETPTPAP